MRAEKRARARAARLFDLTHGATGGPDSAPGSVTLAAILGGKVRKFAASGDALRANLTLEWVSWFNHHRLLEPIAYLQPAEFEASFYRQVADSATSV